MKRQNNLESILAQVRGNRKTRRITSMLACLVVLVTLWRLTLPAITLEWGKPQAEGITEPEMEETLQEEELLTEETLSNEAEEEEPLLRWATLKEAEEAGYPDAVRVDRLICGHTESEGHTHSADCIESYYTAQAASFAEEAVLAMPAQRFEGEAGSLSVRVDAAEGAFPEATEMALTEADAEKVRRAAAGLVNGRISQVLAVDIGFLYEGEKIEPEQPVQVVLSGSALEGLENPVVLHIDGEGNAEIVSHRTAEEPAPAPRLRMAAPLTRTGAAETDIENTEEYTESADAHTEEVLEGAESAEAADEAADIPKGALVFEAKDFSVYAVVTTIETTYITADGETYGIKVTCGEDAGIPEGAELAVRELTEEEYADYRVKTAEALGCRENAIDYLKLLDISIVKDGEPIQPQAKVDVEIRLLDKAQSGEKEETGRVVHFGQETSEELACVAETVEETATVTFKTDAFSVYAVTYTVDFHYEVDGKVFEFSLPGGGYLSFRELVTALEIAEDDPETEENELDAFLADVQDVAFSNPELVDVSKTENETTVGQIKENRELECQYSAELTEEQIAEINQAAVEAGDWALISLKPFDTEERLTVTMGTGDSFVIVVTDAQIRQTVISASGETYEIIVTYEEDAGIPENAELEVREIMSDTEEFQENVRRVNAELEAQSIEAVMNPVQFDISIVADGVRIEPREGSILNVEVRLAKILFEEPSADDPDESGADSKEKEEKGFFLYGGDKYKTEEKEFTGCRVMHVTEDGQTEIIQLLQNSLEEEKVILQFKTGSFSDYLFDTTNEHSFNNLPSTIYVGDEIYMWAQADYWVTNIGSVVSETKHNNGWDPDGWGSAQPDSSNYKTVTALQPGTFRIVHKNDWNNGNPYRNYKEITVLPARTGTTPPATIDTVSNSSIGLSLNLFDYDLDNYLDDYFNGASHYDDTCIGDFAGHGINSGNALKFWGSGIGSNYGGLNQYVEHGVTSIVNPTLNSSGYPVLSNSSGGSGNRDLSYLFTPSNGTDKIAYTNVDGLFKKEGDYYVYDSDQNYAWYNPATNRFEVYERTYKQKSGGEQAASTSDKSIGFFPFHKWDENYDLYVNWNKTLNHHFGMSMSVPFSLPKDPKAVTDTDGNPIVFEFSGDDDMWVFIDGKLAMDIGGIHQPTTGKIDFKNQTVTVNGSSQTGFNFSSLYDGKKHTLQVFYIERGGCDSNCKIKFNLTQYGDIHFDKVDKDNPNEKLTGAVFGIYKDESCTTPLLEQLKDGSSPAYIAKSDAQGRVQFSDIPLGTYYLKELRAPDGYPLDDTVHKVEVYLDQSTGEVKVKVTIDGKDVELGVNILNGKPAPIDLGLKKEWQDTSGNAIAVPDMAKATFELKRIRSYRTYTETPVTGSAPNVSKLIVGGVHNGVTHDYKEYSLVSNSQVTVSWSYADGYDGQKACVLNGTTIDKSYVTGNIVSEAFTMPAAGQTAKFYIKDGSANGDGILGINVAGQEFVGNSGGGVIHEFKTISEPDPGFSYTGDPNVVNNRVTLPINGQWQYDFRNLPLFEKVGDTTYNYSYYLEEVSTEHPAETKVVYVDANGKTISAPIQAQASQSGTQTIQNQVDVGALELKKIVTVNGNPPTEETKTNTDGTYKFSIAGVAGTDTEGVAHTVEITFADGKATSCDIDGTATPVTGTDHTWTVLIASLIPGDYVITETDSGGLMLKTIEGGKTVDNESTADIETKSVTVTVTPGKNASAALEPSAKAEFTNNYVSYEVTIVKVDAGSNSILLGGAVFDLYTEDCVSNSQIISGKEPLLKDLTTAASGENKGKVSLGSLPAGTYYLFETQAPSGYLTMDTPITLTVSDGKISLLQGSRLVEDTVLGQEKGELTVVNSAGAALPSTGGPGAKRTALAGLALTLLALAGLAGKRKSRA